MDNDSRSLEAEDTWDYADNDEDSTDLGNQDSLVLSDPDMTDDSSGVDTMEHMSGKKKSSTQCL